VSAKKNHTGLTWYTMDLHLHTPASEDYLQPEIGYLDILKQAAKQGLDIIAFTDHNSVAGYRRMQEEIDQLKLLQQLNRLLPEEETRLAEYQRLLKRMLVLPGFEFTATFGFHILAIFPLDKPVRDIEHLLLELNIPSEMLDDGSITVGASVDVLTAYKAIHDAGGMAIAAHANSNNGVAMRRFPFGGQTKIAYTQDPHLFAWEGTD
jgi:PHP family Zn ribbon phosphoesterase